MEQLESKEYTWAYITRSTCLSRRPCELVSLVSYPSDAGNEVGVYNGEGTGGQLIGKVTSEVKRSMNLNLRVPVYCDRGLYVDLTTNVTGVFAQWREFSHKG